MSDIGGGDKLLKMSDMRYERSLRSSKEAAFSPAKVISIKSVVGNYKQGQTIIGPEAQLKCPKEVFLKINRKGRSHQEGCGRGRRS